MTIESWQEYLLFSQFFFCFQFRISDRLATWQMYKYVLIITASEYSKVKGAIQNNVVQFWVFLKSLLYTVVSFNFVLQNT